MKCFLRIVLFVAACYFHSSTNAQNRYELPQLTPKSPNAAELGKYGEIPVSLNNGMTQLSIPLLQVKVGSFELPVSLSYRNNGLKVDEIPSYTGLGFSLIAGGQINYEQRGLPDFSIATNGMFSTGSNHQSVQKLNKFLKNQFTPQQRYDYLEMVMEGQVDSEYDLYHFQFMGQSGTFYLDSNQRIIAVPTSNLKIKRENDEFNITDEQGNQYFFGTFDHNELSPDADPAFAIKRSFNENATYFLSRIKTAENREIYFSYTRYPFAYQRMNNYFIHFPLPKPSPECPGTEWGVGYTWYRLDNQMLSAITFDGGSIQFELGSEYRNDIHSLDPLARVPYLRKIKLLNEQQTVISEYNLQYSNASRLRLEEVIRSGPGSLERWRFQYYGDTSFPSFRSLGKDHWGYYNAMNNPTLLPAAPYADWIVGWVPNPLVGANRESSDAALQGMLKKVMYPTGGSSEFVYEPNRIRFTDVNQIRSNHFLRGPLSYSTENLVTEVADGQQPEINGSFTLGSSGTYAIIAQRDYMPLNFIESYVSLSTTPNGPNLLNTMNGGFVCVQGSCSFIQEVQLTPGTYYYTLKRNIVEHNPDHGQAYLSVTRNLYNPIQPYRVGGFRISTVETSDSIGRSTLKKYVYADRVDSVFFASLPNYVSRTIIQRNQFAACLDCGIQIKIHEESVVPMVGGPVEYLHVTELTNTTGDNGKIEYEFIANEKLTHEGSQPYVTPFMANWKSGQLKRKRIFKKSGSTYSLINQDSLDYESIIPSDLVVTGIKAEYERYCPIRGLGFREFAYLYERYQTERFHQKSATQTLYDVLGKVNQGNQQVYTSTKHTLPTEVTSINSRSETISERIKYSADFDTIQAISPEMKGIRLLQRKNILQPVEQFTVQIIGGVSYVTDGKVFVYNADTPVLAKVFRLPFSSPVLLTNYVSSTNNAGQFIKDTRYEELVSRIKYGEYQRVLQEKKQDGVNRSYLWDYKQQYLVCEAIGVVHADIAYTGFEADSKGGYSFTGTPSTDASAISGKKVYSFTGSNSISKSGLSAAGIYIVSYWTKNSTAFTIAGTQSGYPIAGRVLNGWKYFEHKVTGQTTITINGTSGLIDELRIYPAAAQVTTFTYDPLVGISSICDARNNFLYYEYDAIGRLRLIRDQDKNVVKLYDYQYEVPSHNNTVWTTTGATQCKPCPQNGAFFTNILQREERNTNPNSTGFNQTRWVDAGTSNGCPTAVWQNTGSPTCLTDGNGFRTGVHRTPQKDMNPCSPTYNQIMNIDVVNFTACPTNTPMWQNTANTRCKTCPVIGENTYTSDTLQQEQRDINPGSSTYNTVQWIDVGVSGTCVINPDWQFTATPIRCKINNGDQNTGEQEREQRDYNPCSPNYNQTKWVVVGVNTTACPLPYICSFQNCVGEDRKCINNVCTTGIKVYTSTIYDPFQNQWECYYHYEFSDGTWSDTNLEYSPESCL